MDNDDSAVEVDEPKMAVKKSVKQAKQKHGWSTNDETVGESDGNADGELIIDRLNQYLTHILYSLQ